ncbi:thiol-disulfide oxidoreductase DCC family protein [Streptomyces heilongjiangensis]|uniref:Thiol-disulfide oxidoreductase DCC family protein n=1 Tax=Streptomyces heilongjiangensis TaxID=945052 RepID=A0ABW1B8T3_9ACTN|nr:DCC1-like thiol-disulfide oxidoreductase family protein [Streptomyces heilongjiangensis]MDC2947155.1 DCC1-like thiol-disulfide oxidoreductase family protein [Streptomyces heilongjiangensis]
MTAIETTADRGAERVPVRGLTVLYDARCTLCVFLREWLGRQRQLVPLDFVPAGSDEARRRFPVLDHRATLAEITVVGDAGQVYRGPAAWVVCLWALREHRPLAHRLSTPAGARLARGAVLAAAKWRGVAYGSGTRAALGQGGAGARQQGGGGVHSRADGWTYDPRHGWTYTAPPPRPDAPSGAALGGAAAPDAPSPALPGGCDGGACATG